MLAGPAPAWRRTTGVLVVGSGAAGLTAALRLAECGIETVVLTRADLLDSCTDWAQGGLAAVWAGDDTPDLHRHDTLVAGAGLCEDNAVRTLVAEAPRAIRRLVARGADFDRGPDGAYDLHLEGGHAARRILHAGGDATGHEVALTLARAAVRADADPDLPLTIAADARAVDVLTDAAGAACGVRVRTADGTVGDWLAGAVVLASGGIGQAWGLTTNPPVATGDGQAMAWRAGAALRDMEFVQFHPTVLWLDPADRVPGDRGVLISEAVRGEGAVLVDDRGERVMAGHHPLADLAPRDVVSAQMQAHMATRGATHLFLDARHLGADGWQKRFPSILALCRERGIDPVSAPIPVRPGAHYLCGGIEADLDGRTGLPGLYAVGEVAGTGVQGANRLASNSITEGLVAGHRVAALLARRPLPTPGEPVERPRVPLADPAARTDLHEVMDGSVGVLRDAPGLTAALAALDTPPNAVRLDDDTLDQTNLHTVARLVATAAAARTESRGCHRRADHPGTDDSWRRHLSLTIGPAASILVADEPMPSTDDLTLGVSA